MKSYTDLKISSQSRSKTIQKRIDKHLGLDTETLDGKLHLICYSDPQTDFYDYLYIDFDENEEEAIKKILLFLTKKDLQAYQKWFYNIDYDFRAILRWLPEDNLSELYQENKTIYGVYTISYLPRKFFKISVNKKSFVYYDIMQFYTGGLDKNGKKYLNLQKDDKINSTILGSSKKYWLDNLTDVIKYCIQDCKITAALGDLFYHDLWHKITFNPRKPYSAGSISQEFFINNTYIPVLKNIPEAVIKLHQDNYRGGRIEILQRGFFDNLNSYDIKSAYPAQMINLMDYTNGMWKQTTEYDDNYHGIYEIEYSWYNDNMGVFAQTFQNKTIYPIGEKLRTVVNEKELLFLDKYTNYGEYEIINGYQFIPFYETYPYRDLILQLFNEKETTKDDNERLIYKLFINSIYGKTAQAIYDKHDKKYHTGRLYNPIYSNRITSLTRLELIKNAIEIGEFVIGFSTDSIQTTKEIKNIGSKLGDFTFEYNSKDSCILMSGVRYTEEKQKVRGFGSRLQLEEDKKDTYTLKEILLKNPEKDKISIYVDKPVTIFQGLRYHKYTKDDINIFMMSEKILDINGDNRRIWHDDFVNCHDCLSRHICSTPIMI